MTDVSFLDEVSLYDNMYSPVLVLNESNSKTPYCEPHRIFSSSLFLLQCSRKWPNVQIYHGGGGRYFQGVLL